MSSTAISKWATAAIVTLYVALLLAPRIPAQLQPRTPQWQIAAGGKMKFDAASLKENKTVGDSFYANVPLDATESYVPTGGLLSVRGYGLTEYMEFAYKLSGVQYGLLHQGIPKWANGSRFDLQARAPINNPTKDQLRLMVQDLLEERFKLAVHWETRQMPVFGLAPAKAGKLGPQVRVHSDQPPCVDALADSIGVYDRVPGGFPTVCGHLVRLQPCPSGQVCWGARDFSLSILAPSFLSFFEPSLTNRRPIVDQTGLSAKYDFFFEWDDQPSGPESSGLTMLEALKQQLGLKLVPQTGPVEALVIDHVEEPSPN